MERKVFWILFVVLGTVADIVLPLWWALAATIPIVYVSWWWRIAAIGSDRQRQYRDASPAGRVFQRRCTQIHWSGYRRM